MENFHYVFDGAVFSVEFVLAYDESWPDKKHALYYNNRNNELPTEILFLYNNSRLL